MLARFFLSGSKSSPYPIAIGEGGLFAKAKRSEGVKPFLHQLLHPLRGSFPINGEADGFILLLPQIWGSRQKP